MDNTTLKYEVLGKSSVNYKGLEFVNKGDTVQFYLHNRGIGVDKSDYILVVNGDKVEKDSKGEEMIFSFNEIMTFVGMLDLK